MDETGERPLGYVRVESWEGEPTSWWAETQTYGTGDGCSRPFWLRAEALAYAKLHDGYVRPLYLIKRLERATPPLRVVGSGEPLKS